MSDNKLIRKINIGITIPKKIASAVVKNTLQHINYGKSFFINKVYLQQSEIANNFSSIATLPSNGSILNVDFFNKLIHTKGAEAFLLLEAGVELTIPKLLKMLMHLNHFKEHGSVSPKLIYQEKLKKNQFIAFLENNNVQWKEKSLQNNTINSCYLVKKEVIDAIGPADTTYKTPDYWVLDYNVRANLKGKKAVYLTNVEVKRLLIDSFCNEQTDAEALNTKIQKLKLT